MTKSITDENKGKLPDLLTILMQGNSAYILTIENMLSLAADTNDNTWIDRFAEKDFDDMLDELEDSRPDLNTPSKRAQFLDTEYGDIATDLSSSVPTLRSEFLDYEATGISVTDATEADINIDIFEKIVDQKYIARCYFAGASGDESDGDEQIGDYVYYASSSADDVCVSEEE